MKPNEDRHTQLHSHASSNRGRRAERPLSGNSKMAATLEMERSAFRKQIEDIVKELDETKLENVALKRQQEGVVPVQRIGSTKIKQDLEHAKSTNKFLLEGITAKRDQCSQMEQQTFELNMKIEALGKKMNDILAENREQASTIAQLQKEKSRAKKVMDENRKIKGVLLRHNIRFDEKEETLNNKRSRKNEQSVLKPEKPKYGINTRRLEKVPQIQPVKGKSRSMEDLRLLNNPKEITPRHDITTPFQGKYVDIHRARRGQLRQKKA